MPVYSYKFPCPHGGEIEVEHKLCDPAPKCEHCGRQLVLQIAGKTGIALKGGGWAADLYTKANK